MAGDEGTTRTVVVAVAANLLVTIAKAVAAVLTGSAALLAETLHSVADTANEVLLFVGVRRSSRRPDAEHPFGWGQERYFWSLLAAVGIFVVGGVASVYEGVRSLREPEPLAGVTPGVVVLLVSAALEGWSWRTARRELTATAGARKVSRSRYMRLSSDPASTTVYLEDSAALIGLVLAGLGVFLHQVTGDPVYDAIGSILVGLLLGAVAIVLIRRNLRFLTGEESDQRLRQAAIATVKSMRDVERVTYLRMEYVGPRKVLLVAAVDIRGDQRESDVARQLRAVEAELERDPNIVDAVLTLSTPEEADL